MTTICAQPLTEKNFKEFGCFSSMEQPAGYSLAGPSYKFFRDAIVYQNCTSLPTAFSTLQVKKTDSFEFRCMEYHDYASEAIMPLDGDIILALAPANGGELREEDVQAFRVPKGVMVLLRTAVWHAMPMSIEEPCTNILVVLPERVYHNDLATAELPGSVSVTL